MTPPEVQRVLNHVLGAAFIKLAKNFSQVEEKVATFCAIESSRMGLFSSEKWTLNVRSNNNIATDRFDITHLKSAFTEKEWMELSNIRLGTVCKIYYVQSEGQFIVVYIVPVAPSKEQHSGSIFSSSKPSFHGFGTPSSTLEQRSFQGFGTLPQTKATSNQQAPLFSFAKSSTIVNPSSQSVASMFASAPNHLTPSQSVASMFASPNSTPNPTSGCSIFSSPNTSPLNMTSSQSGFSSLNSSSQSEECMFASPAIRKKAEESVLSPKTGIISSLPKPS